MKPSPPVIPSDFLRDHAMLFRRPGGLLFFAEWRWTVELSLTLATSPALMTAPRGDGHPVWVLPGFLGSDRSTFVLRAYLTALGYETHGWNLGQNLGRREAVLEKLKHRLEQIHSHAGRTVSLVGWSLGGVYARELASAMPAAVRSIVALGSPLNRLPESSDERAGDDEHGGVPMTSIYSKTDGIVDWRTCLLAENDRTENVAVCSSHVGMGLNPSVLWIVADRLAQREGRFARFERGGPFALTYPR